MNILITGAGFLAQNLVKEMSKNEKYNKIIVYSRSWEKHLKIKSKISDKRIRYFVGDIRNLERLDLAMKDVDICIHTAALKDLKSCEYNINECISNNIYGSENIVKSAIKNKVKKALLISTDKAVNPQNAYGVSKLMAEKLFLKANVLSANKEIRFEVIRYGNVFGSTGSVLDVWLNLIKNGIYEIPIAHVNMSRYFMSIKEAVNLITYSITHDIYYHIPVMRKFKIMDLFFALQDMIEDKLSFKIIGKKYGEKIYEEIKQNENCANGPFMSIDELKYEITNNELWRENFEKNINIEFNFENNQIALKVENNVIQNLNEFSIEFKDNQFKFAGERAKKDRNGQLMAEFEKINLFNYFSNEFLVLEDLKLFSQNLNFALHNIYETSKFNAKKYIEERGFSNATKGLEYARTTKKIEQQ